MDLREREKWNCNFPCVMRSVLRVCFLLTPAVVVLAVVGVLFFAPPKELEMGSSAVLQRSEGAAAETSVHLPPHAVDYSTNDGVAATPMETSSLSLRYLSGGAFGDPSRGKIYHRAQKGVDELPLLYGNGRAVIPLLLTHKRYHGLSLLAATIQTWVRHLLLPQRNIDLIIFFDAPSIAEQDVSAQLSLTRAADDDNPSAVASYTTPHHPNLTIRVKSVNLTLPKYVAENRHVLQDRTWMRCGCPPYCPVPRATVEYIQGTRWYTHDMFSESILQNYSFWIKLDVDIWFFRDLPFNIVGEMEKRRAVFAHTGYKYNGGGCSDELHAAIVQYCKENRIRPVSLNQSWWMQDDNVYYSNFVVSSMAFHLSPEHLKLANFLNQYPTGFFKHRWTDQSLFHKVFGVFLGPSESSFALNWGPLRWVAKRRHPRAVFWHGKRYRPCKQLRMWTSGLRCGAANATDRGG